MCSLLLLLFTFLYRKMQTLIILIACLSTIVFGEAPQKPSPFVFTEADVFREAPQDPSPFVRVEAEGGSNFQFPDGWNADTDVQYQFKKDQPLIEKFEGQLKRYIFDVEPVDEVRTIQMNTAFCETFCSEKEEWSKHQIAFRVAKMRVMGDLDSRGFDVKNVDSVSTIWATSYGDYLIISRKE